MRKPYLLAFCVLVFASVAIAQTSGKTKWHCDKPTTQNQLEVPDGSGHLFVIAQGNCTATQASMGEKSGQYTEFQDAHNTSFSNHGRLVVTMDNGDKAYYDYSGSGDRAKKSATNKWKVAGGTGKFKSGGPSGACTGTLGDDGSSDWNCTPAAAAAAKTK
jgi:hypothetical protein